MTDILNFAGALLLGAKMLGALLLAVMPPLLCGIVLGAFAYRSFALRCGSYVKGADGERFRRPR